MFQFFLCAPQALAQKAGCDGVTTILEKLFVNIRFDILGTKIAAVEITEEAVLGKERPNYFYANGTQVGFEQKLKLVMSQLQPKASSLSVRQSFHESLSKSTKDLPTIFEETNSPSSPASLKPAAAPRKSSSASSISTTFSSLTDFDRSIFEEIEL